jgi:1-acyl-sn-glycerol-3-phosphate acyltransferase
VFRKDGGYMFKTVFWFLRFGIYMMKTAFQYVKFKHIKKYNTNQQAELYVDSVVNGWSKFVMKSINVDLDVIGKENLPKDSCLFVGNHQGYLDIPLLYSQLGGRIGFIAKKEMEKAPIMSDWMRELHCVFMDRDNPREAIKSINQGIEYIKQGYSMVIFPEGTRSKSDKVGEFKKGSMKLGLKGNAPIVPITICGSYKVFEQNNRIKTAKVRLIIDEPIDVKKLSKEEQNNLSEIIRDKIIKNLEAYS